MRFRRQKHERGVEQIRDIEHIRISAGSIASEHHPDRNEDSHFQICQPDGLVVAGVFDGLGGYEGSEEASQTARQLVESAYQSFASYQLSRLDAAELARAVLLDANRAINRKRRMIATTAALMSVHYDPAQHDTFANIAWAGDSRVYHFRDGQLLYRTLDDGYRAYPPEIDDYYSEQEPEYQLQSYLESVDQLITDPELERIFSYRNILEDCLGVGAYPVIHSTQRPIQPGDVILVCSDGIHDNLTNREINRLVAHHATVDDIIATALARSCDTSHVRAKPDDMTAVLLRI